MYFRLSGFYLFYFAALGALLPYWGLYLKSLGFSAGAIGELIALLMATKIVAPNLWGWIADHTGRRMAVVRVASLLAVIAFCGVFFGQGYWWMAGVMILFSFFWNAALPQFEAVTLSRLGADAHRYSSIRLWGSVGFIVTVAALGPLLGHYDAGLLPWVLVALYAAIWISTLLVPDPGAAPAHHERARLWEVLRRPHVAALLLVCFLMQASHGPYYGFYSIYLEEHGYARWLIGQLWALGVIAEVAVFMWMHRWLPRFGARRLLLASLALTALRWLLIAYFVDSLAVLAGAQILHAASFGVFHAVAITLIHRFFTGRHQGRGQALYSSLGFGAGGAVGSLYAGYLWGAAGGGAGAAFVTAAALAATALLIARRTLAAVE
ncbi:MAG: MFS transporter [Gammaproteobacteria bacterium]|nr:MFS transporter [Gammaproteobacteria bacterium]